MSIFAAVRRHPALLIALVALVLRLLFVFAIDPSPDFGGGDTNWYMKNGRALVTTGTTAGPLQTAPLYLVFLGSIQVVIPGHGGGATVYTQAEMQVARTLQAFMGAALTVFVFLIARRLLTRRAALLAATVTAISPALVIESGQLLSENLFLFFMWGGLALYVRHQDDPTPRRALVWGGVMALATLTRAVFVLFPLGLAVHMLLLHRQRALRAVGVLSVSYGLLLSTWTVYNMLEWNRFVIGGEGIMSFLYQGVEGHASPREVDAQLQINPDEDAEERYNALKTQVKESILGDPGGWFGHRLRELAKAALQPHNTVYLGGESIKDAAQEWLQHDRSPGGLRDVLRTDQFWPKLALYVFHFAGLLFGLAGMAGLLRRWRALLPLYGVVVYFTGIHLVLLALPRYLFPMYIVWWMFAAASLLWLWDRLRQPRGAPATAQPGTRPDVQ
jgi:4-amino-4-deoxy-L-arabinose transferase-like glycosyltransferase